MDLALFIAILQYTASPETPMCVGAYLGPLYARAPALPPSILPPSLPTTSLVYVRRRLDGASVHARWLDLDAGAWRHYSHQPVSCM